jgi:hypothetical protein
MLQIKSCARTVARTAREHRVLELSRMRRFKARPRRIHAALLPHSRIEERFGAGAQRRKLEPHHRRDNILAPPKVPKPASTAQPAVPTAPNSTRPCRRCLVRRHENPHHEWDGLGCRDNAAEIKPVELSGSFLLEKLDAMKPYPAADDAMEAAPAPRPPTQSWWFPSGPVPAPHLCRAR